jgi:FkbM family methyltransferase
MAFTDVEQRRIALTTSVHDTDSIPKVANAGQVETRDGQRVQVMHNGVVVEADCYGGPWMTEIIKSLRGHHEPQEEVAFYAFVERLKADTPAPVMVELGSFWAYYSLWFKKEIPAGTSVCVEPDPLNLEVGRRNFALNGLDARFVHAAVGSPHGRTMRMRTENESARRKIPLVSLAGLMRDEGLERIELLLSDVQGAEVQMLEDARPLLQAGRVRFLVVSTHHHVISGDPLTHQRCRDVLEESGAHVLADHTVHESASGDGLIVASTDPRDRDIEIEFTTIRSRDCIFGEPEYELAQAMRFSPAHLKQRLARSAAALVFRF